MKYVFLMLLLPVLAFGQTVTGVPTSVTNVSRGMSQWTGFEQTNVIGATTASVSEETDWLLLSGFGHALPAEAVIDSIRFGFELDFSADSTPTIGSMSLFSGENPIGTSLKEGDSWASVTVSGNSSYWGVSLTPGLVNSLSIGIWANDPYQGIPNVNNVYDTVYYHIPVSRFSGPHTALLGGLTYSGSTADTSGLLDLTTYKEAYFTVQSQDSASMTVKYQLSVDGQTWGVATTLDSLSTASNTGDAKTMALTALLGAPYSRLILTVNPSFRLGKTTPYYGTSIIKK